MKFKKRVIKILGLIDQLIKSDKGNVDQVGNFRVLNSCMKNRKDEGLHW